MYVSIDQTLDTTKRWLQYNIEPLQDVLIKWRETVEHRQKFLTHRDTKINDILEHWPLYKQSFGHNLVKKERYFYVSFCTFSHILIYVYYGYGFFFF